MLKYNPLDPLVGVAPDRKVEGVSDLDHQRGCLPLEVLPLSVALARQWNSDACLVSYLPYIDGSPQETCPRLNKKGPVLQQLRAKGVEVRNSCLVLDYDNPGHRPWTTDLEETFRAALISVSQNGFALAGEYNWGYTTLNGARLIYVFAEPVAPEVHEAIARGVIKRLADLGLKVDPLSSWNHLFACPRQTRESRTPQESWDSPFFEIVCNREEAHEPDAMPTTTAEDFNLYASVAVKIPEGLPDLDEAVSLSQDLGSGKMTAWGKKAKRRLRGRDCYDTIYKSEPMAEEGARDATIHSYVGQAVALLIELKTDAGEETTPDHVYGLFYHAVQQLEPDEDTPDWTMVLWSAIRRWWAAEAAKIEQREQEARAREEDANQQQLDLLDHVREWCDSPGLYGAEDRAWAWVSRRAILSVGSSYYVIGADGYYTGPVGKDMLHAEAANNGVAKCLDFFTYSEKGGVQPKNAQTLLNDHGFRVQGVVGRAGGKGHFLEGVDTKNPILVQSLYRLRTDIEPEFNADVDTWLKHLFGKDWEIAVKWLAWALAFEEGPICALSLEGKKGSGKKMLVQGLAECLEIPEVATARDLVSDHQEGLLRSPFVVVDEGWPAKKGFMHPADMFRHLVSGDPTQVNPKYKSVVRVNVPARVMFTANNLNVVRELTGGKTLSPDDREAIGQRLLHVTLTEDAAGWLDRKGGGEFTGRKGSRWIAKDSGGGSDCIVAKHMLWLHAKRHHLGRHGKRFLVEGPVNSKLMFQLRTQSGLTPVVTETILLMLGSTGRDWSRRGFLTMNPTETSRGRLYVLTAEVKKFYEQNWKPGSERLTIGAIDDVMRGLVDTLTEDRVLAGREHLKTKRWHSIDIHLLESVAKQFGWVCPPLDKLVVGAEVHCFQSAKKDTKRTRDKALTKWRKTSG